MSDNSGNLYLMDYLIMDTEVCVDLISRQGALITHKKLPKSTVAKHYNGYTLYKIYRLRTWRNLCDGTTEVRGPSHP